MSKYYITKTADELNIPRATARIIAESCETREEFLAAIDEYKAGHGFVLID